MENLLNQKYMLLIKLDMHYIKKINYLNKLHIKELINKYVNNLILNNLSLYSLWLY